MRPGELRLEPQPGTLEGYGREAAVRVYESSRLSDAGNKLLTIVSKGPGLRMTRAQVDELMEFLSEWRRANPA